MTRTSLPLGSSEVTALWPSNFYQWYQNFYKNWHSFNWYMCLLDLKKRCDKINKSKMLNDLRIKKCNKTRFFSSRIQVIESFLSISWILYDSSVGTEQLDHCVKRCFSFQHSVLARYNLLVWLPFKVEWRRFRKRDRVKNKLNN